MANDPSRVNIHNESQVIELALELEIRYVANPQLIYMIQLDILGEIIKLGYSATIGCPGWFYYANNAIATLLELLFEPVSTNTTVHDFFVYSSQCHLRMVPPNLLND
jgi:hypothetical protein